MRTQEQLEETEREADRQARASRPEHLAHGNGNSITRNRAETCPWCREELEADIKKADASA